MPRMSFYAKIQVNALSLTGTVRRLGVSEATDIRQRQVVLEL